MAPLHSTAGVDDVLCTTFERRCWVATRLWLLRANKFGSTSSALITTVRRAGRCVNAGEAGPELAAKEPRSADPGATVTCGACGLMLGLRIVEFIGIIFGEGSVRIAGDATTIAAAGRARQPTSKPAH